MKVIFVQPSNNSFGINYYPRDSLMRPAYFMSLYEFFAKVKTFIHDLKKMCLNLKRLSIEFIEWFYATILHAT